MSIECVSDFTYLTLGQVNQTAIAHGILNVNAVPQPGRGEGVWGRGSWEMICK